MAASLIIEGDKCPECGHSTELFVYPHANAGMWQCTNLECGAMDEHDHKDTTHEVVEVDTMREGEHDTYTRQAEICTDCGVEVGV